MRSRNIRRNVRIPFANREVNTFAIETIMPRKRYAELSKAIHDHYRNTKVCEDYLAAHTFGSFKMLLPTNSTRSPLPQLKMFINPPRPTSAHLLAS
jgi:hypothetical protein